MPLFVVVLVLQQLFVQSAVVTIPVAHRGFSQRLSEAAEPK